MRAPLRFLLVLALARASSWDSALAFVDRCLAFKNVRGSAHDKLARSNGLFARCGAEAEIRPWHVRHWFRCLRLEAAAPQAPPPDAAPRDAAPPANGTRGDGAGAAACGQPRERRAGTARPRAKSRARSRRSSRARARATGFRQARRRGRLRGRLLRGRGMASRPARRGCRPRAAAAQRGRRGARVPHARRSTTTTASRRSRPSRTSASSATSPRRSRARARRGCRGRYPSSNRPLAPAYRRRAGAGGGRRRGSPGVHAVRHRRARARARRPAVDRRAAGRGMAAGRWFTPRTVRRRRCASAASARASRTRARARARAQTAPALPDRGSFRRQPARSASARA